TLNLQGGTLAINGNASASTSETITTFNVTNGEGRINLNPVAGSSLTLTIGTLSGLNSTGSAVFSGTTGSAARPRVAPLVIPPPSLSGGKGGGANGTTTMSIRTDVLGDPTSGGNGVGFLVKDSATGNWRALGVASNGSAAPGEYLPTSNTITATAWGGT